MTRWILFVSYRDLSALATCILLIHQDKSTTHRGQIVDNHLSSEEDKIGLDVHQNVDH